jgi:hypothetical protein
MLARDIEGVDWEPTVDAAERSVESIGKKPSGKRTCAQSGSGARHEPTE